MEMPWLKHYENGIPASLSYPDQPLYQMLAGAAAQYASQPAVKMILRYLPAGQEGDEIFLQRIRHGATRDGRVYMPPFEGILSQEAMWTIRSWLETVRED